MRATPSRAPTDTTSLQERTSMPMSPRLLRPRQTGFSPKSISGLVGWWDASVTSSLAQLSTGSTAVSADNDPVGYWADQSGNGRNLTQATNNNRPTYNTNVINGRPVINFDGLNDALLASFTLTQPIHYFLAWRFDSSYVSGNPRAFDGATGNSMSFFRSSSSQLALFAGTSSRTANVSDAEATAFNVMEIQANRSSTNLLYNGANRNGNTGDIGTNAPNGIYLGVFGNGFSNPGDVSFAEVLIYSRILESAESARVRKYLGSKYGISTT